MKILIGHVLDKLLELPDNSVQCVVTSPPYWGKRKYSGEQKVIWGGNKDCQHKWINYIRLNSPGGLNVEKAQVSATKAGIQRFKVEEESCAAL